MANAPDINAILDDFPTDLPPNNPSHPPPGYQPSGGYPNQPASGGYPPQNPTGYPGQQPGVYPGGQQPSGYPAQPGGYPGQQPGGYPGQPGGYPGQPGGYPGQPGYPAQQPGYPGEPGHSGGYPGQQPAGYPGQPSGYPGQQPGGYPGQQPSGYPGQQPSGYPDQKPGGYPGQQPGFTPGKPGFPGFPGSGGFDPRSMVPLKPVGGGEGGDGVIIRGDEETGGLDVGSSFSSDAVRKAFVKKVYLILTLQLLVTFGFVLLCLYRPVQRWVQRHPVIYYVSYGVFIVTYFMLACPCCSAIRRKWPWNFLCLSLLTLAMSYMTGMLSAFYSNKVVLIALGIAAVVCFSISIFAMQTKIDFTLCRGFLFVFSIIFMLFGIGCIIYYSITRQPNDILQLVYASIGALMFSLFLLVDTQMIIGGKNRKYQISPEDYIFGALQLYLDIVQLFIMILQIVGSKKVMGN